MSNKLNKLKEVNLQLDKVIGKLEADAFIKKITDETNFTPINIINSCKHEESNV